MLVVILLTILALVLPLVILRPFSRLQKTLVLLIILAHLVTMFLLHYHVLHTTGFPIVRDVSTDTLQYYEWTEHFADHAPFSITRREAIAAAQGTPHFGYQYVLGTLWTITPYPVLSIRLFKTMLFFISLSCLSRVWRTDYGSRLAMRGFVFMGVVCTPAFYYNFRNLKDSLILALFMFIMALLDTLLRPKSKLLYPVSTSKTIWLWFVLLIPLYALSTLRIYVIAMLFIAVLMHIVAASRVGIKVRILLFGVLVVIALVGIQSEFVADMLQIGKSKIAEGKPSLYILFRAFVSPLPWRYFVLPLIPFHCIYLLLLPYALYTLLRHFRINMNWHLFLYMLVIFGTGVTGNPARKRLIGIPILLTWMLAHSAYKRWTHTEKDEYENYDQLQQGEGDFQVETTMVKDENL